MKKLKLNTIEIEVNTIVSMSEFQDAAPQEEKCSCIFLSCRPRPK